MIGGHGDKIEIGHRASPNPYRLRRQINTGENSQAKGKAIGGAAPGQTKIGGKSYEEKEQSALHDVRREIQEMNSGKNGGSSVVRHSRGNRNCGKQQNYRRSPEPNTSELLQSGILSENAGENLEDNGEP